LIPLAGLVCVIAEVALFASVREPAPGDAARSAVAVAVAALSILVLPAVTTGVVVVYGLGSFSTPYQSTAANEGTTILPERYQSKGSSLDRYYDHLRPGSGIVAVVDSTALAAPLIMVTGREFLPIGGYQGGEPEPDPGAAATPGRHRAGEVLPGSGTSTGNRSAGGLGARPLPSDVLGAGHHRGAARVLRLLTGAGPGLAVCRSNDAGTMARTDCCLLAAAHPCTLG
jgi:hypothetical protein